MSIGRFAVGDNFFSATLNILRASDRDISSVTQQIASGLEISSVRDNGAVFAVAQNQRSEVALFDAISRSLDRSSAVVDITLVAGQQLGSIFNRLREIALEGTDPTLLRSVRETLQANLNAILPEINSVIDNASFGGANLLKGDLLKVRTGAEAQSTFDIGIGEGNVPFDFSLGATNFDVRSGGIAFSVSSARVDTVENATEFLTDVNRSIQNLNKSLGVVGSAGKRIDSQIRFNESIVASISDGIGALVDVNIGKQSAKLSALQVQRQLSLDVFGITRESFRAIISLF